MNERIEALFVSSFPQNGQNKVQEEQLAKLAGDIQSSNLLSLLLRKLPCASKSVPVLHSISSSSATCSAQAPDSIQTLHFLDTTCFRIQNTSTERKHYADWYASRCAAPPAPVVSRPSEEAEERAKAIAEVLARLEAKRNRDAEPVPAIAASGEEDSPAPLPSETTQAAEDVDLSQTQDWDRHFLPDGDFYAPPRQQAYCPNYPSLYPCMTQPVITAFPLPILDHRKFRLAPVIHCVCVGTCSQACPCVLAGQQCGGGCACGSCWTNASASPAAAISTLGAAALRALADLRNVAFASSMLSSFTPAHGALRGSLVQLAQTFAANEGTFDAIAATLATYDIDDSGEFEVSLVDAGNNNNRQPKRGASSKSRRKRRRP